MNFKKSLDSNGRVCYVAVLCTAVEISNWIKKSTVILRFGDSSRRPSFCVYIYISVRVKQLISTISGVLHTVTRNVKRLHWSTLIFSPFPQWCIREWKRKYWNLWRKIFSVVVHYMMVGIWHYLQPITFNDKNSSILIAGKWSCSSLPATVSFAGDFETNLYIRYTMRLRWKRTKFSL